MMLKLAAPSFYYELTKSQKDRICNGMGARDSLLAKLIPNTMYFLDVSEAGNIQDYMYHVGETADEKLDADRVFLANMIRIINHKGGWLAPLRRLRALKYYEAVYYGGDKAYWKNKTGQNNAN
jgi:hypothetical protein